jgi:DNA-binding MarR family transcriptional regulator
MPDGHNRKSDGGAIEENSDPATLLQGIELPDDSLFILDDYLQMYAVAASKPAFSILIALSDEGRLSASELEHRLERKGNELHHYLRRLKRAALIRNRRDPNTGTETPYSYYELTNLGRVILTEGLKSGVQTLAAQEHAISEPSEQ